ncbi:hypothetical protein M3Y99_01344700 [Aphelenchoides fujianensis]|nr:hypothetical protein M3Y99_01344700 [Aphelenchoides fujianensis]
MEDIKDKASDVAQNIKEGDQTKKETLPLPPSDTESKAKWVQKPDAAGDKKEGKLGDNVKH